MTEKLELAHAMLDDLEVQIGLKHRAAIFWDDAELRVAYEIFSDYVKRNELKGVDVKLPFTILQSLSEVS